MLRETFSHSIALSNASETHFFSASISSTSKIDNCSETCFAETEGFNKIALITASITEALFSEKGTEIPIDIHISLALRSNTSRATLYHNDSIDS